jgi:hypothetical protein
MRSSPWLLTLFAAMPACHGGGSSSGDETSSSGAGETTALDTSTSDSGAVPLECDPNVEFAFPTDEVGLVAISIDAVRAIGLGDMPEYSLYVHGDDIDVTQVTVRFPGTPMADVPYQGTGSTQDTGLPVVTFFPNVAGNARFLNGTVTYSEVGSATGENLHVKLELESTEGRLDGCVATVLTAQD